MLTVSSVQSGRSPWSGVALSMPTVVSDDGAAQMLEPDMSEDERERLVASAAVLRQALAACG